MHQRRVAVKHPVRSMTWRLVCLAGAWVAAGQDPLGAQGVAPPVGAPAAMITQAELVFWQSVSDSGDRAQYDAYLSAFPQGLFAELARAKINAIRPTQQSKPNASIEQEPRSAEVVSGAGVASEAAIATPAGSDTALTALDSAFVDELHSMALSQGNRHQSDGSLLPARPVLSAPPPIAMPAQFCSEVERNAFHDSRFLPTVALADANNRAAIAHVDLLRSLFNAAMTKGDASTSTSLSRESQAFQPVAKAIYQERIALDAVFSRIMAVPIAPCTGRAL